MNITVLSTSPRQGSNSLKVAKAIEKLCAKQGHSQTHLFSFEHYDLPMVGQGSLDKHQLTEFQSGLVTNWEKGQVVFMVVPEYNWITSGQLINAIHQLGGNDFGHLFDDKVFAMCGVSSGRGGRLPGIEMMTMVNKMISFLDKRAIVSPKIFESHETHKNVDEAGNFQDNQIYVDGITAFVAYTLDIAQRWFGESA